MKKKVEKKTIKISRPPIVTVMGHVDHGKTTLLDAIRKTNKAAKEVGGITQSIGAYQVAYQSKEGLKKITFIDTPGHEAFSAMRARGADVTDLIILVVAADDGVKPQTIEAIKHAQAAKVPILVAINKIDLPGSDIKKIKSQLAKEGLIVEDLGGETVLVSVSAKQGQGIETLLEMVLLMSEMLELHADPKAALSAVVIESHLDSKKGPVVSLIVREGTLKTGQNLMSEGVAGRVKALHDEWGKPLAEAGPAMPIEITGFKSLPPLGAAVYEISLKEGKEKQPVTAETRMGHKEVTLEDLLHPQEHKPGLNMIIKTETEGSLEAVIHSLKQLPSEQFELAIIYSGVGELTKSDVLLAKTTRSILISFGLKTNPLMVQMAQDEKVYLREYLLIYELLDEIEEALWGKVTDTIEAKIAGRAEVIGLFSSSDERTIAGLKILEGKITLHDKPKIFRNEIEVGSGRIKTIKHLKEDVKEVKKGVECGITLEPDFAFEKGDILEVTRG